MVPIINTITPYRMMKFFPYDLYPLYSNSSFIHFQDLIRHVRMFQDPFVLFSSCSLVLGGRNFF